LLATLVEDRGPEPLVRTVCEVSGKAVYLLDEHFQATVHAGGDERSAEGLSQLRRRFWEGHGANIHERLITFAAGGGEGLAVLVRPLLLRGAVEGYLAVVGARDDFGDFDYQVADRTASVLAIELAKQSAVVEARLRVQGDFLEELLDNPRPEADQLIARARTLGYDLTRPHLVFVLRPRLVGNSVTPRQRQRFIDVARRRLVLANVATLLRAHEETMQVVAPCPPGVAPEDHQGAVTWVERFRSELETVLAPERLALTAGIGRSADGTITYHAALREASQAAEIAATLPGGSATLHFAHLGALRLIFHLAGNPELQAFQRDLLGPLETYDRVHRSELLQTLEAFFRAGGNHVQAARDLNIHRNTLIYRLDRIRDLLDGVDLEDPDTRLNLQLALKIRAAFGPQA
jgi:PucR family transcriptional regulator, purine catabolism regulatory protein